MSQIKNITLDNYLNNISKLYQLVDEWLKEKSFLYEEQDIEICEEASGKYSVRKLIIRNDKNEQIAEIRPIAAWVIGGDGRLDIIGKFDKQIVLYINKERALVKSSATDSTGNISDKVYPLYKGIDKDGWYWIKDMHIGRAYALDKELFFDLLAEVSDYDS